MSAMDALSESAEMMIKNINVLASSGERVRTSDLSTKTELKPASVTEMIQRLGDLGLVDYEPYHGVHLTKQGQHVADVIEHRFNILERFLTEILGVDGNEASEVACRMEHVLTRDVEHKLTTFLGVDPQKESELFCHKINIESDIEHKYLPLSNFGEGKTGIVKLIFESYVVNKHFMVLYNCSKLIWLLKVFFTLLSADLIVFKGLWKGLEWRNINRVMERMV